MYSFRKLNVHQRTGWQAYSDNFLHLVILETENFVELSMTVDVLSDSLLQTLVHRLVRQQRFSNSQSVLAESQFHFAECFLQHRALLFQNANSQPNIYRGNCRNERSRTINSKNWSKVRYFDNNSTACTFYQSFSIIFHECACWTSHTLTLSKIEFSNQISFFKSHSIFQFHGLGFPISWIEILTMTAWVTMRWFRSLSSLHSRRDAMASFLALEYRSLYLLSRACCFTICEGLESIADPFDTGGNGSSISIGGGGGGLTLKQKQQMKLLILH